LGAAGVLDAIGLSSSYAGDIDNPWRHPDVLSK
jgi:hypothetical protein